MCFSCAIFSEKQPRVKLLFLRRSRAKVSRCGRNLVAPGRPHLARDECESLPVCGLFSFIGCAAGGLGGIYFTKFPRILVRVASLVGNWQALFVRFDCCS